MKIYTTTEAAVELDLDASRIMQLCRAKRLGYTLPKHGNAWVITEKEIEAFRKAGPKKPGRPRKPRPKKLVRISEDGNHVYE